MFAYRHPQEQPSSHPSQAASSVIGSSGIHTFIHKRKFEA
jgi:hypothetical protein